MAESYFEQHLQQAVSNIDTTLPMILVSHQPPYNTKADALPNGMHVGSKSVRNFIEQYQPLVCFTGHIHEGIGIDAIGDCKIINPGPVFKGQYAYAEISDTIEVLEIRSINQQHA